MSSWKYGSVVAKLAIQVKKRILVYSTMKPKKSLGQNFLRDKTALARIIVAADLSGAENILEIGPGEGVLTERLLEKAGRVLAVEKDEALAAKLQTQNLKFKTKIENEKLKIISQDILEINLPKLLEENHFTQYRLVANIPYYITGKIIRLFLETQYQPELIVLLTQKEVAERIAEKDGKRSILSLAVGLFGQAEIVAYVPKESFYPAPKVASAIVKIVPHSRRRSKEESLKLMRIIKIGFASPRKTLLNNLAAGLKKEKNALEKILIDSDIASDSRAETLSLEQWIKLEKVLR